jgi:delta(3,5)-delta(2,4)-dienoyl-CoA isomerase
VRVCARGTKFAVKEVDIGLAADIGTLSRLPKVVGSFGWVKEVALTARIFGAEEALRVGFVNRVFESKEAAVQGALEMAALMATKSPVAVQGTKEILNYSRDHSVQDGLRYTAVWNSAMLQTNDVSAALLSGLKKRIPTFEKL